MLDFRINTFLAVCEYMNFTRASEKLCITQPAVSQHIKYLENFYESKLFEYEGKKIKLTESGEMLYKTSLKMKQDEKYLKKIISQENDQIRKVVFGATLTIGEFILPKHIHDYFSKENHVDLEMRVENTKQLLIMLDKGEIDFAFIEGYFPKGDYGYKVYSEEKYICIAGNKFNDKKQQYLFDDLLDETLIVRENGSGTRDILEKNLEDKNLCTSDFKNVIEIGNINAIKYLVENNDGITFLYEAAAEKEIKEGRVKKIEIKDLYTNHNFYMIWRKDSVFSNFFIKIAEEL